jgi:peptidyl-prolyl cis-trans isomerase SurA
MGLPSLRACLFSLVLSAGLLLAGGIGAPAPAHAQTVALVNGSAVTSTDIARRTRLIQLMERKNPSRQEILQELIDERIKIQIAQRYRFSVTEDEVNGLVLNIARRNNITVAQLTQQLAANGTSINSMRDRMRADLTWSQLVRGRYQNSARVNDKEVIEQVARTNQGRTEAYFEYQLRSIILVVPRGSPEAVLLARRREGEQLRTSFADCTSGPALVRNLREAVIREPIVRTSADFPDAQRAILDQTQVGRLTPVEITRQGVEMLALCAKKEIPGQNPDNRVVRDQLTNQRLEEQGKKWLTELRQQALIVYR